VSFPQQVTPRVYLLGNTYFNLYLVKGETCAIVEGGVSGVTFPFLDQLAQLGVSPESITYLVILHSHFDHMMVFPYLRQRYPWVKIVSSELNRDLFSNERILSKIVESDRRVSAAMAERGLVPVGPTLASPLSFHLDVPLREGSRLDLGNGVTLKFIEAPGHAPDCLAAFEERESVLFCSDAAGFYAPPDFHRPNHWFSLTKAVTSIDKMRSLGADILCSGHYGVLTGQGNVRAHLERARQAIEDFRSFVRERTEQGNSMDRIAQEVTEKFSRGFLEFFPAQENFHLWRLLVRRTLEDLGINTGEIQK